MLVKCINGILDEFRHFKTYVIVGARVDALPQLLPFFFVEIVLHEVSLRLITAISRLDGIWIEHLIKLLDDE